MSSGDKGNGVPGYVTTLLVVLATVAGIWFGTQSVKEDVPKLQSQVDVLDERVDFQAKKLDRFISRVSLRVKHLRSDTDDVQSDVKAVRDSLDDLLTLFTDFLEDARK